VYRPGKNVRNDDDGGSDNNDNRINNTKGKIVKDFISQNAMYSMLLTLLQCGSGGGVHTFPWARSSLRSL
jgi:hypothetical protein